MTRRSESERVREAWRTAFRGGFAIGMLCGVTLMAVVAQLYVVAVP